MKAHLLYQDQDFDFAGDPPANRQDLVQDLELSTLFDAMARGDSYLLDVSTRVTLSSLDVSTEIVYRQHVLADCLANPEMTRAMYAITVASFEERRGIFWGRSSQLPSSILSGSVSELEMYVGLLKKLRQLADDHVDRVRSEGLTTLFRDLRRDLDDDYFDQVERHLKRLRFQGGVLMSSVLGPDNSGINYVLRSPGERKPGWKERVGLGPRMSYSFTIPPRDEAGSDALADLTGRGINLVANAVAQSADHIQSYFIMLRAEIGFYVSCLNLRDQLIAKSQPMCFPDLAPADQFELTMKGLCDVALVLRADGRVVGNDVDAGARALVIVTGANSGGKSTFLRSVGQAQVMAQCGMFVAAEAFGSSVASSVVTHFIREEDSTMRSGRLVEELSRMSGFVDQMRPHSMVLFNESFAATNEREGSEIARQVVRALLDADARVLFVTHQYDFAKGFYERRTEVPVLFLRAERESNGQRSFKLREGEPLPTSFGEDIFRRIFFPDSAVGSGDVESRSADAAHAG